jgi:hypothetical protein
MSHTHSRTRMEHFILLQGSGAAQLLINAYRKLTISRESADAHTIGAARV